MKLKRTKVKRTKVTVIIGRITLYLVTTPAGKWVIIPSLLGKRNYDKPYQALDRKDAFNTLVQMMKEIENEPK